MSRLLCRNKSIELLEPYEGKLSRTVLRGEGGSNALDLPDNPSLGKKASPAGLDKAPSISVVAPRDSIRRKAAC